MALDPNWMHRVPDCSQESIANLIELLASSWRREHWLYREAELDDLWRHAEMELRGARSAYPGSSLVAAYQYLYEAALTAHNRAAYGRLDEAVSALEEAGARLGGARAVEGSPKVPARDR